MDFSALTYEMIHKTGELMKTSFWPKKATAFIHGEMFMLNHMAHRGESVTPGELAAAMNTSSARVAVALRSLESKGLVTRRIDMEDRRKINVSLTRRGLELVECHKKEIKDKIELILRQLGEDDTREYIRIVERMTEIAQSISSESEETSCRHKRHKEHWHD